MPDDQDFILKVRHLSKSFYQVKALDDVNLNVKAGEIHAVMGENGAGKSTLMKILIGLLEPDSGKIIFQGNEYDHSNVQHALKSGISMVHQEILPVPELTVAENIYLGKEITRIVPGWIDETTINRLAKDQLNELNVKIDVSKKMKDLGVAEMQMVEIAKALSNNARIIIMDEPTSSLSDREVENLFKIIEEQKERGVTIIYISHRMEEIFRISDRVTVLRDGKHIDTRSASKLNQEMLINMMVGRNLDTVFPKKSPVSEKVILSVTGLERKEHFSNISFNVRKGEVLGIAGLMGAGRTEIVRSIMGLKPADSGEIQINDKKIDIKSSKDAIDAGISYVSEDRKGSGLVMDISVKKNLTLSSLSNYSKWFLIKRKKESLDASKMIEDLSIKTPSLNQKVKYLSGGNQQKVVIGKTLLCFPDVLILNEPTRGIDVKAKFEIYNLINRLAREGKAIIFISSELPEILGLCHRIIVLSNGKITADMQSNEASQEKIMKYAMQN